MKGIVLTGKSKNKEKAETGQNWHARHTRLAAALYTLHLSKNKKATSSFKHCIHHGREKS